MPRRGWVIGWVAFGLLAAGCSSKSKLEASNGGGAGSSSSGAGSGANTAGDSGNAAGASSSNAGTNGGGSGTSGNQQSTNVSGGMCVKSTPKSCGSPGLSVCGDSCCVASNPYCCTGSSRCSHTLLDALNSCTGECLDLSEGSTSAADGGSGDPCAPCASWVHASIAACTPPNELSFGCYCANAKAQKCALDTPNCSTDKAKSQMEIARDVAAANATGDGTCTP